MTNKRHSGHIEAVHGATNTAQIADLCDDITRCAGARVLPVKKTVRHDGFKVRVAALVAEGDETPPHISMHREPGKTPGRRIVLRVSA